MLNSHLKSVNILITYSHTLKFQCLLTCIYFFEIFINPFLSVTPADRNVYYIFKKKNTQYAIYACVGLNENGPNSLKYFLAKFPVDELFHKD